MKQLLSFAVAAVIGLGAASVYAGPGCCAAGKAKDQAKAEGKSGCSDVFSKLNLTDEQKTKLAALKKECDETKCTESARTKFTAGLKEILTPEQLAQCEAECKKAGVKSCPAMSAQAKAEPKS